MHMNIYNYICMFVSNMHTHKYVIVSQILTLYYETPLRNACNRDKRTHKIFFDVMKP